MDFYLAAYGSQWPLAALAGIFVVAMGISVIAGAFIPRMRMALIWIGFFAGIGAIVIAVPELGLNPPPPTRFQLGALIAAIVVELAGFAILMRPLHRKGERAVVAGTLAIVGVHFVIMWPVFGPLIAILGATCCINAWIAWRSNYGLRAAWLVDGVLKLGLGGLMAQTAFA